MCSFYQARLARRLFHLRRRRVLAGTFLGVCGIATDSKGNVYAAGTTNENQCSGFYKGHGAARASTARN